MEQELFDANQAAEYLGVTPTRVRQLCGEGRLGKKVGSRWLFTRAELEAFAAIPRKVGRPGKKEGGGEAH